ncbi:hypothetical protein CBR_g8156 [Chara braunii]|uniref:Uncharacterized protein n=1 Tax=Chara braunii TaxID=69332 RepID=A0A388KLD4_CHABU|nr:hypothetical protein CBR_g8156 [Chara braunii]|eukprot:GBG70856.1 hypothetical protein CBR_g8156 [Chara braunii]
MREYFRKKIKKHKIEEEMREREAEERKRKEEEDRKEADRLREAEAREAKLEAKIVRMMAQQSKVGGASSSQVLRRKSPNSKAHMLREIRSYIDESEDDSEEVRNEADRLIEAIEKRKGKRRVAEARGSGAKKRQPVVHDISDEKNTPPPVRRRLLADATSGEMLEYALEMHRQLSEKKVPKLRTLCKDEGVEWTKRDSVIRELIRSHTKMAYDEDLISPIRNR